MKLTICHLYPDLLNLYGDQGNIVCLVSRLKRRGIDVEVLELKAEEKLSFGEVDFFFAGGGQDFEQEIILRDLEAGRAAEIKAAVEDEKVFLAICGGYQILGNYFQTWDGRQMDFVGAIDVHTIGHPDRLTGNYMFACPPENGGEKIVGFENHSGRTYLGDGVAPLGQVLCGYGNNGEDKTEGARYKNTFCSYSHGPILPKNPVFADFLISLALTRKYPDASLEVLDDTLEQNAHRYMQERLS